MLDVVVYFSCNKMISLRRLCLFNGRFPRKYYFCGSTRSLFTKAALGIDIFNTHRKKAMASFENQDLFRDHLKHISETNNKNSLVFLDDVRKMILIADSDEDLKLLFSLLRKFYKQEQVMVFQGYYCGPEVMRLLHVMNRHREAVEVVEDSDLFLGFQNSITQTLLLDLLFENGEYEEVIRMFEMYQSKVQHWKVLHSCALLYLSACCKLSTAESFEKAIEINKLVNETRKFNNSLRRKLLIAALAIKQNQPAYALEIFVGPTFQTVVENLKFMAYAQSKRFEYLFCAMRCILNSPNPNEFFLINEVVSFIENEIKKEDCNGQYGLEFQKLKEELLLKSYIVNKPLDEYLYAPLNIRYNRTPHTTKKHSSKSLSNQTV